METKTKLKLDWATHQQAVYACRHFHYSKTIPVPPLVKIGVWENDKFIGVVLFSRGASPDLLKPYGLIQTDGAELTRVALTKHEAPVSKILAFAVKMLKKQNPGLKLLVSFADSNQGHHGGIYQACNWVYAGLSSPSTEYWKDGKRWHPRQLSETGFTTQFGQKRSVPKPSECKKIKTEGKHRYLYALEDSIREKIKLLAKKYPKRTGSIVSDASGSQLEEGSANLTPVLQNSTE